MLGKEICCWICTINPSKHHLPMVMSVQSSTSAMCMAMDLPDQRECVPKSSGAKPSLAAPTRLHSALMTAMMLEALTEQRPWGVR